MGHTKEGVDAKVCGRNPNCRCKIGADGKSGVPCLQCRYTKEELDATLYDVDPNCEHELDTDCGSGIRCLHCSGWYCL